MARTQVTLRKKNSDGTVDLIVNNPDNPKEYGITNLENVPPEECISLYYQKTVPMRDEDRSTIEELISKYKKK